MPLKNYLFSLSLLLFVGCTQQEVDHTQCESKTDSLSQVHSHAIDSLSNLIDVQDAKIQELEDQYSTLMDLIQDSPPPKKNPPKDLPEGIPTIVPKK